MSLLQRLAWLWSDLPPRFFFSRPSEENVLMVSRWVDSYYREMYAQWLQVCGDLLWVGFFLGGGGDSYYICRQGMLSILGLFN